MKEFYFTNIDRFFETVQMQAKERKVSIAHNLRLDYESAKTELNAKFSKMLSSEQSVYGKRILLVLDDIIASLDGNQLKELEYLKDFRKNLVKLVELPDIVQKNYPEVIFRDKNAYRFFMETLLAFNVIDEDGKALKKFQAVAKAIFDTKEYKDNIFNYNISMKDYVQFLNSEFHQSINPNAMSSGIKHEDAVQKYFNRNF